MVTVAGVAILIFVLIELPALRHLAQLRRGIHSEYTHATHGHDVPLPISITYGGLHLAESLWPGLGLTVARAWAARPRRAVPRAAGAPHAACALIAGFALLWYAVHELAPLKPYPDVSRYMLPMAPLLAILATSFVYELFRRRDRRAIIAAVIVAAAAIPALVTSVRINGGRPIRARWCRKSSPQLASASPSIATPIPTPRANFIGEPWLRPTPDLPTSQSRQISSMTASGATLPRKDRVSRPTGSYYRRLNALPHLDVSNGRPTLGYFNPVLRIVALDGNIERLQQISAAITAAAPEFKVRLIDRKPKT